MNVNPSYIFEGSKRFLSDVASILLANILSHNFFNRNCYNYSYLNFFTPGLSSVEEKCMLCNVC